MLASFVVEGTRRREGDVDDSSSSRTAENPIVSVEGRNGGRRQKKEREREDAALRIDVRPMEHILESDSAIVAMERVV